MIQGGRKQCKEIQPKIAACQNVAKSFRVATVKQSIIPTRSHYIDFNTTGKLWDHSDGSMYLGHFEAVYYGFDAYFVL